MNLTICLTMCVIVFTSKDKKDHETNQQVEETTHLQEKENVVKEETTTKKKVEKESTSNKTETTGDNHSTIIEKPAESENGNQEQESETTIHEVQNPVGSSTTRVTSSCNVHTEAEVSSPVVGTTDTSVEYSVDLSKSNDNWVAIVFNGTLGYISAGYCQLQ